MEDGRAHLAATVAAHLREWDSSEPYVELAVFGSRDPVVIARMIDAFCVRHLGVGIARALFHQSSIGSVTGVVLADARRVVVKGHQPDRSPAFLAEIARVRWHLAGRDVFASEVLVGPLPLGRGFALAEAFIDLGRTEDAHRPEIRRALAHGLAAIVETCAPLVETTVLEPTLVHAGAGPLWPTPHSKLFDFEATAEGAAWIDEIAADARRRLQPAGARVIGHADWRQEHVRFVGERIVAAFDWDSLCCDREPILLGAAAHAFCADWSQDAHMQAPSLQEARAFVGDYEHARGSPLPLPERRLCGAAFAYACAYTARCGHALGEDSRGEVGTFQHLVATEGANLLSL